MNNEYLWSKTGSDAEVEGLEDMLGEFRFDGISAPELPATNTVPVARFSKRRFVLALSFAASAAAVILVAMWVATTTVAPVASVERNLESIPENVESRNGEVRYPLAERARNDVPIPQQIYFSRARTKQPASKMSRSQVTKTAKEKLTREEKYAYDRLMFALSIAGSKLRVVQDTIDRKGEAGPQSVRNE